MGDWWKLNKDINFLHYLTMTRFSSYKNHAISKLIKKMSTK